MSSLHRTGYESVRPTHQCASSGRRFEPGEVFVATLSEPEEPGEELVRHDFAAEAWERGARPEGTPIAVWRTREPADDRPRSLLPDTDELWAMFEGLDAEAAGRGAVFRYLLALMLMRKRILGLVDQRVGDGGRPVLVLARRGAGPDGPRETFEVTDPGMDQDAVAAGTEELGAVLGGGGAPGGEP